MSDISGVKIVLVTMVKNESRIIQRLMASVRGKVDAIVVCDTGSTDNTVERALQFLGEFSIPGTVCEFPFVNFGKSRTRSFQSAQDWLLRGEGSSLGWDASKTWALLLDGDMMLGPSDTIRKDILGNLPEKIAGVSLKQANGSLVYSNVRLIRFSEPWICKGATHEAWTCPPERSTAVMESPVLVDHNDGGCKSDKYPRDVRLLKEDLEEMPNDARTLFYLGQTYLCMRNYTEGIPTLRKRIEVGGWDEETYIAYMYLGECLIGAGQRAEGIKIWLDGWQFRQHRTEIPMKLISLYRNESKSQFLATMFLEKLFVTQFGENLRTGQKEGKAAQNRDLLFVNKRDVDFHIWEELMILAYYSGLERQAFLRLDDLDMKSELAWHDFNSLFGQLHWYHWTLKSEKIRLKPRIASLPWADEDDAHVWQPFNPSIRVRGDGEGYDLVLRYANYWTNEAKNYHFRGFDGQVLTRSLFTQIARGGDFNKPGSLDEMKIDTSYRQDMGSHIKGMEDCRLVQNSDVREFMGTSKSYADNGMNKIFHGQFIQSENHYSIRQLALPSGVSPAECQKNWLPFRNGPEGRLLYIYSFSPFRICDEEGKDVVQVDTKNLNGWHLKEWRGSAGPVAWQSEAFPEERYICVMHKVQIGGEGRWYYHRFMTLDKDLKPSRVSCFVRMTKERVEYWSGMCPSLETEGAYKIVYGVKDSEAWMTEIKSEEIERLMFYNLQTEPNASLSYTERVERLAGY